MKVEEVTTEVCGPVAGPVTILETNDFWRRVLCCFNRRSMGSNFLAGEPEGWRLRPLAADPHRSISRLPYIHMPSSALYCHIPRRLPRGSTLTNVTVVQLYVVKL